DRRCAARDPLHQARVPPVRRRPRRRRAGLRRGRGGVRRGGRPVLPGAGASLRRGDPGDARRRGTARLLAGRPRTAPGRPDRPPL
ncbi:MAG: Glutaredoxin-like domain-containing protein PA3033, partial [uncultured Nocardioidaceae bacterium]